MTRYSARPDHEEAMQPIHSLSDFFTRTGAHTHFYSMGRRVAPCSAATLAAFEAGELAWPFPWLGRAQLACVFRIGDISDPAIWFLSLPLDEQGHLDPAPRDAFLQRLLETLGRSVDNTNVADDSLADIDNLMQDNPLAFTPDLVQRALLHARASADMQRPGSEHLELAEEYLTGQLDRQQWQSLGLQGMADFVVRHDRQQSARLASQLNTLPVEVLRPLCHCLEHVTPSADICLALIERGEKAAETGDIETFCACVRGAGQGEATIVGRWFDELLTDPQACGPDLLAAIAARGWSQLEDAERLPLFLEVLASCERADFAATVRDLALIPRLRLPLLMTLKQARADSRTGQRLAKLRC